MINTCQTAFVLAVCGWECIQEQDQQIICCLQCQRQIALKQCSALLGHKVDENDVQVTIRLLKESQSHIGDNDVSPAKSPRGRKRDHEQLDSDKDTEQRPSKRARMEQNGELNVDNHAPDTNSPTNNTNALQLSAGSPYNSPTATLVRDKPFDPVSEHRYFCPWINSYDESAQTGSIAWQKGLVALFSLPASAAEPVTSAPKSFSDFQAILNRIRTVVQTPNKSVNKL